MLDDAGRLRLGCLCGRRLLLPVDVERRCPSCRQRYEVKPTGA
jgi:hypothetical protein